MGSQLSVLVVDDISVSLTSPQGTPYHSDDERSVNAVVAAASPSDDEDASTRPVYPLTQLTPLTPPTPKAPTETYALIEIPCDVSRRILESMGLSGRVKLSVCSKTLANSIYSKRYLWATIDFGAELSFKQRSLLTDRSLHRLLENVQAKQITKALSVRRCEKIQGYGLEPLRGSAVIEELDLRVKPSDTAFNGRTGLHDSFVLGLLSSMMPFARPTEASHRTTMTSKLFTIRFNRQRNPDRVEGRPMRMHECFTSYSQVRTWVESFDGSLKDRLWLDRVPCSHCNGVLVEKIPSSIFEGIDASAIRCVQCKQFSCGQNGCKSTSRCQLCLNDLCCVSVKSCDNCNYDICEVRLGFWFVHKLILEYF